MKNKHTKTHKVGYLYIIKHHGWIKVGHASNTQKRLTEYNRSFPIDHIKFSYISEKLFDCVTAERILLSYLRLKTDRSNKKVWKQARQEWFRPISMNKKQKEISDIYLDTVISKINDITDLFYEN